MRFLLYVALAVLTAPLAARAQPPGPAAFDVGEVQDAAASADGQRVALWTSEGLYVGRADDGLLTRVLDGPGSVWDAVFGADGELWVLRGTQLGKRTRRGRERWFPLPAGVDASEWSTDETITRFRSIVDPIPEQPTLVVGRGRLAIIVPVPDRTAPRPPGDEMAPILLARLYSARRGRGPWRQGQIHTTMATSNAGPSDGVRSARFDGRGRLDVSFSWGQGLSCAVRYITRFRGNAASNLGAVEDIEDDEFPEAPGTRHDQCSDASPRPCVALRPTLRLLRRGHAPRELSVRVASD